MSQQLQLVDVSDRQRDAMRLENDLIQQMGERLDAMWWLDRHMAEGGWTPELNRTWRRLKDEERCAAGQLKDLIVNRMDADCVT